MTDVALEMSSETLGMTMSSPWPQYEQGRRSDIGRGYSPSAGRYNGARRSTDVAGS